MSASTSLRTGRLLIAPVLVATVALSACGDDDDASSATTTPAAEVTTPSSSAAASSGSTTSGDVNDADVAFAQAMIAHHQQAIEMAEVAEDPARQAGPEVLDLAARVKAAQAPEVETMAGWLTSWGEPVQMDTVDGHEATSMTGMMSTDDVDALATMTATEFDDMWLNTMIEHHTGAIQMATDIQADGTNPDVKALAEQIVHAQQAEIDEMNTLLES